MCTHVNTHSYVFPHLVLCIKPEAQNDVDQKVISNRHYYELLIKLQWFTSSQYYVDHTCINSGKVGPGGSHESCFLHLTLTSYIAPNSISVNQLLFKENIYPRPPFSNHHFSFTMATPLSVLILFLFIYSLLNYVQENETDDPLLNPPNDADNPLTTKTCIIL